jgi:hypothetical protein
MIPDTINGLPLHVTPLVLSLLALIMLPITYQAGENLKAETGSGPLIERHEHLAHQLLIPVIGMAVTALILEVVRRRGIGPARSARVRIDSGVTTLTVIAAVLAVGFGAWTAVQTVRVGEAGARAVWGHSAS